MHSSNQIGDTKGRADLGKSGERVKLGKGHKTSANAEKGSVSGRVPAQSSEKPGKKIG